MKNAHDLFKPEAWASEGAGPLFLQFHRHLSTLIIEGQLPASTKLPTERDLAVIGRVSRVTVRNALAQLVQDGHLEQRRGAGTFVKAKQPPKEHSLTMLFSFSDYMRQHGITATSRLLKRGVFIPSPDEQLALGLMSSNRVSRIDRLRYADDLPHALEWSSIPNDVLPDPDLVVASLYDVLRATGFAPIRAVQKITAVNIPATEAHLLGLPDGAVVLWIERTSYLPSGRPVEFTRGYYRSDTYAFMAELKANP